MKARQERAARDAERRAPKPTKSTSIVPIPTSGSYSQSAPRTPSEPWTPEQLEDRISFVLTFGLTAWAGVEAYRLTPLDWYGIVFIGLVVALTAHHLIRKHCRPILRAIRWVLKIAAIGFALYIIYKVYTLMYPG